MSKCYAIRLVDQTQNAQKFISYYTWDIHPTVYHTIVWEKFDDKKFLSLVWHDENWMHEIFLTMNKEVAFLFIGDSKGRKYFTMNKFHTKIYNGEIFLNYSMSLLLIIYNVNN